MDYDDNNLTVDCVVSGVVNEREYYVVFVQGWWDGVREAVKVFV